MKKYIFFILINLNGCLVWELSPPYSSSFSETVWVNKDTNKPIPKEIYMNCLKMSFKGFETINKSGLEVIKNKEDEKKSDRIYASCLRENGFVFNASYKYCYKFPYICQKYKEYRK